MIGVGIISFDRPQYLMQLLESLEAQRDAPVIEYHLFQDGAVNKFSGREVGDPENVRQSVRLFMESKLGQSDAHVQHQNVGIGINQLEAYDWMCAHYDRIAVLEDDVVLSPYWAHLLPTLFDGLAAHPDAFGFTTDFKRRCKRHQIEAHLGRVMYAHPHWWMIAFMPDRWARIRPNFMHYYELIRECDYRHIPCQRIQELFDEVQHPVRAVTSQDGGKDMAVRMAGMQRATLMVNRGISIGREGVHFNPSLYERMHLHEQEPYIFESDATRDAFEWPEEA